MTALHDIEYFNSVGRAVELHTPRAMVGLVPSCSLFFPGTRCSLFLVKQNLKETNL